MNLFTPKKQEAATPPGIDMAQQRISSLRSGQRINSRAASMLSAGKSSQPQVARRELTGN